MKQSLLYLSLIGTLAVGSVQAQDTVDLFFLNQQFTTQSTFITGYNSNAGYYEGTPFFNSQWVKGSVITSAGNLLEQVEMKYEAFSQLLMVKHKGDSTYIHPQIVKGFSFDDNGKRYSFSNGHFDENLRIDRNKYLQVLAEGKWSLYKDVQKVFKEANFDPVFQTGNRYDNFSEQTRYLFVNPQGEWIALIPRRRSVERFFGEQSGKVRDFVRQNDLDYANDTHLAQLFEFVNTLD